MDRITRLELHRLASHRGKPKASIYMPTYRAGREVRQNAIRYRNLLKQVAAQLTNRGVATKDVEGYSGDAWDLAQDNDWWQHQADGLAVFFTRDDFFRFRVPWRFDEQCTVGPRFRLAPLVSLLQDDGQYYVLAVSQNKVRLFYGSKFTVSELEPSSLPENLRSALNIDEYASSLQHHAAGVGRGDAGQTLFHGHGGSDPDVKKQDEILQFFRRIDSALGEYFHQERVPLVFAGVEYLFPLFQDACHYRFLVDKPVAGNPDQASAQELHELTWPVVQPFFDEERMSAIEQYANAASNHRTDDIREIVRAAQEGQVDTLLCQTGAQFPGTIAVDDGSAALDSDDAQEAEDLINAAAVETLANSGRVFSVDAALMPAAGAAAILRYPRHEADSAPSRNSP